jgi:anti-sigma factor RsiW
MFLRHPRRWLAPYAEGLLSPARASLVAGHVLRCQGCRRALDRVRAGQALATRLAPRAEAAPSWRELAPLLDAPAPRSFAPLRWSLAAAAAVAVVAGGLAWRGPHPVAARASAPLEALALDAHRTGTLELRTGDHRVVQPWLGDLPVPATDDQRRLEGASRLAGGAVALGYRVGAEKVTLVIADAAGGAPRKAVVRREAGDLQVASWTRNNRSYALVSRLRGETACTVCHATAGPAAVL